MGETITPDGRRIWVPDFVSPFVPDAPSYGGGSDLQDMDPTGQAPDPVVPPDPRMAQAMTPPAVDRSYQDNLRAAQVSASFPNQQVNNAQYAMHQYGLSQEEAIAAAANKPEQIKDPARRKLVQSAATDLSFPDQRVNTAQQLMHQYGLTQDDAIRIAGEHGGAAHIAQSATPMGTIGQINQGGGQPSSGADLPGVGRAMPSFSPEELDALKPAPPPLTPAQQRQQATPDGQTQLGQQQQQSALTAQEQVARATGAVQGKEADDIARQEREGVDRANKIRDDAQREREQRMAGIQQRQDELEKLIGQEANTKIDDNRRWHDMNTGKKLTAVFAMAMSGLGEALMGKAGPNPVIGMLQKAIEDDVAAQVRERDQAGKRIGMAKSSLDSYRQITGDMGEAQKLKLSEEYDRTAQQVRAISSQYASPKAKLQGEMIAQQFQEKAGTLRGSTAEVMWNRDVQKQQLSNQRQQTAIAGGHLALAGKQFEYQKTHDADLMKLQAAGLDLEAQKLQQAGQGAAAQLVLKQGIPAPPVAAKDEQGNVTLQSGGSLKNADGSPLVAPTEKEAQDLRGQMSTARQIVDMIDEVREIRGRVGGESSWGNSADYQRLQVLKENLVKIEKAGTQGMSSDADMKRLELTLGADNPASFRDQAGKLEEARNLVERSLNAELRYKGGYTGAPVTFTDPLANAAPLSAEQQSAREIEGFSLGNVSDPAAIERDLGVSPDSLAHMDYMGRSNAIEGALKKQEGGILPRYKQTIDTYAATLNSPDATAYAKQQASYILGDIATKSQDPKLRAYAASKQEEALRDQMPSPREAPSGPITSTKQVE